MSLGVVGVERGSQLFHLKGSKPLAFLKGDFSDEVNDKVQRIFVFHPTILAKSKTIMRNVPNPGAKQKECSGASTNSLRLLSLKDLLVVAEGDEA